MTRLRLGVDGTLILALAFAPVYALVGVAIGLVVSTAGAPVTVVSTCMGSALVVLAYRLVRVSVLGYENSVVIINLVRTRVIVRTDVERLTATTTAAGRPIPALGLVVVGPDATPSLVKMHATSRIRRRNRRRVQERLRSLAPADPSVTQEYTEDG